MSHDVQPAGGSLPPDEEEMVLRLLERIVAGEGSQADEVALARWIGADPGRRRVVERLRARWGVLPTAHDVDAGWARMAKRLRAGAGTEGTAGVDSAVPRPLLIVPPTGRRSWWRAVVAVAAAAAIAFAVFWPNVRNALTAEHAQAKIYATATGQRTEFRLPDGTRVILSPESRVRLAADFGTQRRDVYVEGEAYFDVVHDRTRPFTAFAANSSTLDVGTAFAVRSYAEERVVRVVVTQGKVVMSGAGPLEAGDVGFLTADGAARSQRGVDVAALVGWTSGKLVFKDAPLGEVLRDVKRWHGLDVRISDSALATLPVTGTIPGLNPLQEVELIVATLGLKLARHDGQLVLQPR